VNDDRLPMTGLFMAQLRVEILLRDPTSLMVTDVENYTDELVIPSTLVWKGVVRTLREIGPGAFQGKHFTKVVLPDTLEAIGFRAFADNKKLKKVEYKGAKKTVTTDDTAFEGCVNLGEIAFTDWFWRGAIVFLVYKAITWVRRPSGRATTE
jgi:hypothetical protein